MFDQKSMDIPVDPFELPLKALQSPDKPTGNDRTNVQSIEKTEMASKPNILKGPPEES